MGSVQGLRHISLFAGLSDDALSRVGSVAVRRTFAPGETIIVEGAPCQAAYFIAEESEFTRDPTECWVEAEKLITRLERA